MHTASIKWYSGGRRGQWIFLREGSHMDRSAHPSIHPHHSIELNWKNRVLCIKITFNRYYVRSTIHWSSASIKVRNCRLDPHLDQTDEMVCILAALIKRPHFAHFKIWFHNWRYYEQSAVQGNHCHDGVNALVMLLKAKQSINTDF